MPQRSAFDAFATFPWTIWVAPVIAAVAVLAAWLHRPRGTAGPALARDPGWRIPLLVAIGLLVVGGSLAFGLRVLSPVVAAALPVVALRAELGRRLAVRWGWERSPGTIIESALAMLDASMVVILLLTLRHMGELGIVTSVREALGVIAPLALAPAVIAAARGDHRSDGVRAAGLYACVLAAVALGPMAASAVPGLTIFNPPDPVAQAEVHQPRDLAVAYATIPLAIGAWSVMLTVANAARPYYPMLLFIGAFGIAHFTLSAGDLRGAPGVLSPTWFIAAALAGSGVAVMPLPAPYRALVTLATAAVLAVVAGFLIGPDAGVYCVSLLALCGACAPRGASKREDHAEGDPLPPMALTLALVPLVLVNLTTAAGAFARDQIDHRQAYNKAGLTLGTDTEPGTIGILESNQGLYWKGARFAVLKTAAINEGDARYIDAALITDGQQAHLPRLRAMFAGRMFWVLPEEAPGSERFDTGASLLGARRLQLRSVASTYFPGEAPVTVNAVAAREATVGDFVEHLIISSRSQQALMLCGLVALAAAALAESTMHLWRGWRKGALVCLLTLVVFLCLGDAAGVSACLAFALARGLWPERLPAWAPLAAPALAALFRFGTLL